MKKTELKLAISNAYFDVENYSEPIQYFYDDELRWKLMPGFKLSKFVQVQNNNAVVQDNPAPFSLTTEHQFFSVEEVLEKIQLEDSTTNGDEVFEVRFRLSSRQHNYERKVYTFGDMMSQIGGVFEVLMVSGSFLVGMFAQKLYTSSILNKLYQIEDPLRIGTSYTNKVYPVQAESQNSMSPDNHFFQRKTSVIKNVPIIDSRLDPSWAEPERNPDVKVNK